MAWINYTYNSEIDNMRSGILHALEVLEAVRNATLNEDVNMNVRFYNSSLIKLLM